MPKDRVAAQLVAVSELVGNSAEIVPVSAVTGEQVDVLIDVLAAALPVGPAYYPDGELTDEPEEVLMAELIREAALEGVRDELPHSLAVVIDEVSPREGRDDLIDVHAVLYVERDSQKGIVIGKGGARLREVGTAARGQIEKLLGTKIYLDLRVKVAKNWQSDPKQLGRLGFLSRILSGRRSLRAGRGRQQSMPFHVTEVPVANAMPLARRVSFGSVPLQDFTFSAEVRRAPEECRNSGSTTPWAA